MTNLHYIPCEQGQTILFPQRIDEEIAENDLVRILNHIVEHLDPKMMLKIVLYAYMNNIYSCRKIERLLHRDIHFQSDGYADHAVLPLIL